MEIMALEIKAAFDLFDLNKDGTVDQKELAAILSRGNGLSVFSPEKAAIVSGQVVDHFGEEGPDGNKILYQEGFVQWWREELRWKKMSAEEQEEWYAEHPESDFRDK